VATATAPKVRKVRFEAPGNGLNLIVAPQDERFDDRGRIRAVPNTGKRIAFQPINPGKQFYETDDQDEINFLRNHEQRARRAFFEVPRPVPPSAPVIAEIAQLGVDRDIEALAAMYEQEESEHQREDVLQAITDTIQRIETALAKSGD
jgi:hypothetical protein